MGEGSGAQLRSARSRPPLNSGQATEPPSLRTLPRGERVSVPSDASAVRWCRKGYLMFVAAYWWKVHPGKEEQFRAAWRRGTELIQALVAGLVAYQSPRDLSLMFVDFKGGSASEVFKDLPHISGRVTDLDESLALRAQVSLRAAPSRTNSV